MTTYKAIHPVTGQVIRMRGTEPPTDEDIEQAFNDVNSWRSRSKNLISSRPDLVGNLISQLKANTAPMPMESLGANLKEGYKRIGKTALAGIGALSQGVEGAATAPILELQRGDFNPFNVAKATYLSATGKRPTEIGDITNELYAPEWANQILGLTGSAFLPGAKELSKGAGALRRGVTKGTWKAADALGSATASGLMGFGRIPKGLRKYGKETGFDFMKWSGNAEEDLYAMQDKARRIVNNLRTKTTREFGDAIAPYNSTMFDMYTSAGLKTGENTAQRLLDEGLATVHEKTGQLVAATKSGGIPDIVDLVNRTLEGKGQKSGREIRKLLFEIRDLKASNPQSIPFLTDLDESLRSTLSQVDELKQAAQKYSSRIRILEGDKARNVVSAEDLMDTGVRSGRSPLDRILLGPEESNTRVRNALRGVEAEEGTSFVKELYNAAANKGFSSFAPGQYPSLMGGITAASQLAAGNPQMAAAAVIGTLALSPRSQGITYKAINILRSKAIKLRGTPIVSQVIDLVERGIIDPGTVRQLTGRND